MPSGADVLAASTPIMRLVTPAIRLDRVSKRFGAHVAVDDLSLEVPPGSVYGFIGPNGSGKTTTLRMIMRHPRARTAGTSRCSGRRDIAAANDRVGYLPEERGLYKQMKVRRLLRFYAELKGARLPTDATSTAGSNGSAWPTGPTRRSRPCPRAWRRRCSSSPPSSPGRSWCCSTSRSAASTRSTPRCCARRSSTLRRRGHHGHLLDARHGRGREDVRLHLHDLQGPQGPRRHARRDPGRPTAATRSASAWTDAPGC